jgi:UDPglucose--hexose-1-phosphate uridylyltransferase
MPELRQNRFTKEWVIIATERAKRPEELKAQRERKQTASYVASCPFCPGNEAMAPPEVMHIAMNGDWKVRVVPNKFAALAREGELWRRIERSHRTMSGVGIHDVIVETPDHAMSTALLPLQDVEHILSAYRLRFHEVSQDRRIAHVTIFKNHGLGAGASLEHAHSQLIATPVISSQVRGRLHEALRHYDEFGECIFCEVMAEEVHEQTRVVVETAHFVALEPFASPSPFNTHIYPKRHMASFGDINQTELRDLAQVLRRVLAKLHAGLGDPDFNYSIRTAPAEAAGVKYYHWYVSIIPRLTRVAGFELGSGMFINTVLPEEAAEFLRNVEVEEAGRGA